MQEVEEEDVKIEEPQNEENKDIKDEIKPTVGTGHIRVSNAQIPVMSGLSCAYFFLKEIGW